MSPPKLASLPAQTRSKRLRQTLLRVGDGHRDIGFRRARCDRTILIDTKINVPERGADLVRGATSAEDRPAEIILEEIARPISRKGPNRKNVPPVADPS